MPVTKVWETTNPNARPSHAAIDGETQPYDEPFSIGLMYPGDPMGPPEEVVNCDCLISISGMPDGTPEFGEVDDAAAYVGARYGYGDLTGVTEPELPVVQDLVEQADLLTVDYPFLMDDGGFQGLGTYRSFAAPSAIPGIWGFTDGGVVWMNNVNNLLSAGTGPMGKMGFTAERTAQHALTHEFGHLTFEASEHLGVETIWEHAKESVYGGEAEVGLMQDTDSIWAGDRDIREGFATVFFRLNHRQGLKGLSKAAIKRLRRLADMTNEDVGRAVL